MSDKEKFDEFRALVAKTNKQDPTAEDVKALRAFQRGGAKGLSEVGERREGERRCVEGDSVRVPEC